VKSLSGDSRPEIQEEGRVMELKNTSNFVGALCSI